MARRKLTEESIRKIQISSGSYHISIPIRIMRGLRWKEAQRVIVKKYGKGKILIEDWKK